MLPVALVCSVLLIGTMHIHGKVTGHTRTYSGSRVDERVIETVNYAEVETFSRVRSFTQCANNFKSQHLVFFDRRSEESPGLRRELEYTQYRLKCAPISASSDRYKSKLRLPTQEDDTSQEITADNGNQLLCKNETLPVTRNTTSSPEDPSMEMADVFVQSKYTVITQTGTRVASGTEAYVFVIMSGENIYHRLYLNNRGDEMERGQNDTFQFTSPCNIGNITGMKIVVDSFTPSSWFCVGVEVRRELQYSRHSDVEVFYTLVNKWFLEVYNPFKLQESVDLGQRPVKTYRKHF